MSPCIALIFSLNYANMAALFSKKYDKLFKRDEIQETSQRTLIVVLIKANLPPRSSSAAR
jgi:hypothetical protein